MQKKIIEEKYFSTLSSRAFSTLKTNQDYRLYFLANFIAQIGFWIQATAQSWFILKVTNSSAMIAWLVVSCFGPYVLFGLIGAAFIDRYDSRRLLLLAQAILMGSGAILAISYYIDETNIFSIYIIGILRSLIACITAPSAQKFTLEIVGRERIRNTIALDSVRSHLARTLGPAITGVLILYAGVGACFVINALSFSLTYYALLKIRPQFKLSEIPLPGKNFPLIAILESITYLKKNTYQGFLIGALFLITFIPMSFGTTIPIFVMQTLHKNASIFGLMLASVSIGSILSSLISASIQKTRMHWIGISAVILGIAEISLMFEKDILLCIVIFFVSGFSMTFFVVNVTSSLFSSVKDQYLGRIAVLSNYVVLALGPFGSSISGWLCSHGGTALAFQIGGTISIFVGILGSIYFIFCKKIELIGRKLGETEM